MDFAWLMVGLLAFGAIFPDIFHPFPDPNLNAGDKDTGTADQQVAGAEAHAQSGDVAADMNADLEIGHDGVGDLADEAQITASEDGEQAQVQDMPADPPAAVVDDAGVTLEAEAESEAIWVSEDAQTGLDAAQVEDFQPGEDVLFLTVDAGSFPLDSEVDMVPSEDGSDGLVYVNNELIAVLKGVPQASAADIVLQFSGMLANG